MQKMMRGDVPTHYSLGGSSPRKIFCIWGGFAWVCNTGVSLLYAGPNHDPCGCTIGDFQTILAGIGQNYIQHDP